MGVARDPLCSSLQGKQLDRILAQYFDMRFADQAGKYRVAPLDPAALDVDPGDGVVNGAQGYFHLAQRRAQLREELVGVGRGHAAALQVTRGKSRLRHGRSLA